MVTEASSPILRNAAEIARYIGINKDAIKRYRDEYGLPVWKVDGCGNWKALKSSLNSWAVEMEKANLHSGK